MTKRIHVNTALYFYDGVQVFDATDAIGGSYVGLLVEDLPDGGGLYLVVGSSPESLQRFRMGQVDLRSLIKDRVEQDWFTLEAASDLDQPLELLARNGPIPDAYLPEAGFVLQSAQVAARSTSVRNEALARRNVVIELTLDHGTGEHDT
ncbi:MAG: hypothetical protein NTY19_50410 [Planctomycetota bacterium]|nr:hypothetical protein [Planctomycetota bacterium]